MPSAPSKKLDKPVNVQHSVTKINLRLMDENMTLKTQVKDQLKLIESMRSRKSKAHRRLKALREANKRIYYMRLELDAAYGRIHSMTKFINGRIFATEPAPKRTNWLSRLFGEA